MKATRFYTLLALLMMAGGVTMQGQEQLEVELIGDSRCYVALLPIAKDEVLVTTFNEDRQMGLCRMTTDGTELEYVEQAHLNEGGFEMYGRSILSKGNDDQLFVIYHKRKADSLWICVGDINEDLMAVETGAVLLSGVGTSLFYYMEPQYIIENDTTFAVSYFTNQQSGQTTANAHRIIRFNKYGEVLADRTFTSVVYDIDRLFALNADSTGYLVGGIDMANQPIVGTPCYNLDFNLDTTRLHDEIYMDFPFPGWRYSLVFPYVAKHPVNGRIYVVGFTGWNDPNTWQEFFQDVVIAMFDEDMAHIDKWEMSKDTPANDQRAWIKSIDFFPDGSIAMCAMVQNGFYVARFDEDLNKISEVHKPCFAGFDDPYDICTMPNGDCVVTTSAYHIYRISADSSWNIDEAHDNGLKVAVAYPNPGKDVLNIRTGLKDARVEVYGMSGRMIYGKEITENVTAINTSTWPAGSYVWRVMAGTSTGSVTEGESGKWIRE